MFCRYFIVLYFLFRVINNFVLLRCFEGGGRELLSFVAFLVDLFFGFGMGIFSISMIWEEYLDGL